MPQHNVFQFTTYNLFDRFFKFWTSQPNPVERALNRAFQDVTDNPQAPFFVDSDWKDDLLKLQNESLISGDKKLVYTGCKPH